MSQIELWNTFYDQGLYHALARRSCCPVPDETVKRVSVQSVKVLDLGCGAGRHVWLAADIGYQAYGVDVSEDAIASAESTLRQRAVSGTLQVFDGDQLPFSMMPCSTTSLLWRLGSCARCTSICPNP